jgi:16S rRNA (uracil1498-N3)-methyltransferase
VNLFYLPKIANGHTHLDAEESRHVVKVLRKVAGDELTITDGNGFFYQARITIADAKKCAFEIVSKEEFPKRNYCIHIAIAPTKNIDRTEWFVEKAVEIGIDKITFFQSKTSERKTINLERIQKIAISAMKQSQQAWLPTISGMIPFKEIVKEQASQKFIAHVDFQNKIHLKNVVKPSQSYLILIGPEGDFADDEVILANEHQFIKVSFGANRLRTETAGLVACQILNLLND